MNNLIRKVHSLAPLTLGLLLALGAAADTFVLDPMGRLTRANLGAAGVIEYKYDLLGHLTNLTVQGSAPLADTDRDGLPDAWEWVYFNGLSSKPGDDPNRNGRTNLQDYQQGTDPVSEDNDEDGFPNAAELTAGTNPFDPNSNLSVRVVSLRPLTLAWKGASGRVYRVQKALRLGGAFENLTLFAPNRTPENTWTDPAPPAEGAFYRIEVKLR